MLNRTISCYVLAGFGRVIVQGEIEQRKERGRRRKQQKKIEKLQVTCWEGRKDEEEERPCICIFPTMWIFQKWTFSGSVCMGCTDILSGKQLFDSAGRWDVVALSQKLHPGCHTSECLRYVSKQLSNTHTWIWRALGPLVSTSKVSSCAHYHCTEITRFTLQNLIL